MLPLPTFLSFLAIQSDSNAYGLLRLQRLLILNFQLGFS